MDRVFESKKDCCGCMACYNVCPKNAIIIQEDEYGFKYPKIDANKCVNCGLCIKTCPLRQVSDLNNPIVCYAAVTDKEEILMNCASGGIFTSIAKAFIEQYGIVYGCVMKLNNNNSNVYHTRVQTLEDLFEISGSKYVQSDINFTYRDVKNDLRNGRKVLFSGTPCQIDGLKRYLGNQNSDNLILVDIICHGVPGNRMFSDYIEFLGQKYYGKISEFKFRDKIQGWGLKGSYTLDGEKRVLDSMKSSYYQLFLGGDVYRDSCYYCKYATELRCSDITLGDYWGIENVHPEFLSDKGGTIDEKKGVSCVLINTIKGKKIWEQILCKYINKIESGYEEIKTTNQQLKHPSMTGSNRDKILNIYKNKGYADVDRYWNKINKKNKRIKKIKGVIKRILNK